MQLPRTQLLNTARQFGPNVREKTPQVSRFCGCCLSLELSSVTCCNSWWRLDHKLRCGCSKAHGQCISVHDSVKRKTSVQARPVKKALAVRRSAKKEPLFKKERCPWLEGVHPPFKEFFAAPFHPLFVPSELQTAFYRTARKLKLLAATWTTVPRSIIWKRYNTSVFCFARVTVCSFILYLHTRVGAFTFFCIDLWQKHARDSPGSGVDASYWVSLKLSFSLRRFIRCFGVDAVCDFTRALFCTFNRICGWFFSTLCCYLSRWPSCMFLS